MQLMSWPVGIDEHDVDRRLEKGRIIVPAVPHEDIRFLLGLGEDLPVIHTRVYDGTPLDMRLILLPFLDGTMKAVEILSAREPSPAAARGLRTAWGGEPPPRFCPFGPLCRISSG